LSGTPPHGVGDDDAAEAGTFATPSEQLLKAAWSQVQLQLGGGGGGAGGGDGCGALGS
jgi:hypothetical protein